MTWTHWQVPPFITSVFFVLGMLTLYWVTYNWLVSWVHHQRRFNVTDDQLSTWYGVTYMVVFVFCIQSLVVGGCEAWQFMNFQLIAIIFCAYFLNSHVPYYAFIPILFVYMVFDQSLGYWQSWGHALTLMLFFWVLNQIRVKVTTYPWAPLSYLAVCVSFGGLLWLWMKFKFNFSWQTLGEEWLYLAIFVVLLYIYVTMLSHDSQLKLRLAQFASHDALTRTENFAAYTAAIQDQFSASRQNQTALTMMMFDIDHFKRVNDTYGHMIGDRVLQQATSVVQVVLTANDPQVKLYRTGGEEFNVIFPNYELAQAQVMVQQIFSAINHLSVPTEHGPLEISISVGVSALSPNDGSPIDFYNRVDRNLYHSKRNGRMQITSV
ncbi:GGDEF domain-containing protein [Lactiplantibacillus sp. WILCCON 0030]|uniref:GGDEF domain-containing protein n=1 Tax=Lactiplantibacillus brownii TaxID=3069269 RepID=A0ABU1ABW8_9LACO|nr:GGDEF domain-containing protein [Lactiplantibacillus brownii]MDQ7938356.1 GGDEF domain-containing protein [Lactiplantibacillus brownii]